MVVIFIAETKIKKGKEIKRKKPATSNNVRPSKPTSSLEEIYEVISLPAFPNIFTIIHVRIHHYICLR